MNAPHHQAQQSWKSKHATPMGRLACGMQAMEMIVAEKHGDWHRPPLIFFKQGDGYPKFYKAAGGWFTKGTRSQAPVNKHFNLPTKS